MITFEQFLFEKEKFYNLGATSKLIKSIKPAKPAKLVYNGMTVQRILPVPQYGKQKIGVIGS